MRDILEQRHQGTTLQGAVLVRQSMVVEQRQAAVGILAFSFVIDQHAVESIRAARSSTVTKAIPEASPAIPPPTMIALGYARALHVPASARR